MYTSIVRTGGLRPCVEGGTYWPIKPLSFFCPRACGCGATTAPAGVVCPGGCKSVNKTAVA
eukprot:4219-Prymnesium_polylepis.1